MSASNNPLYVTPPTSDKTLTQDGVPADAKEVGDKIGDLKDTVDTLSEKLGYIGINISNMTLDQIVALADAETIRIGYILYTSSIAPNGNTCFVFIGYNAVLAIAVTGNIYWLRDTTGTWAWENVNPGTRG